jgi:hypothetical protein
MGFFGRLFHRPARNNITNHVYETTPQNTMASFKAQYQEAIIRGDANKAKEILEQCKSYCQCSNDRCLREVFCPECPIGFFAVVSGRAGL